MKRTIERRPGVAETGMNVEGLPAAADWLRQQAVAHQLVWLLAHADDGVIWGRLDGGRLLTSHEAAQGDERALACCPPLREETLQQARLFAQHAELLLWRDGDNAWHARLIRDAREGEPTTWDDALDERQMLWGTRGTPRPHGFTLLEDGAQGLRHAVPMQLPLAEGGKTRPPRLVVRHYLDKNDPFARIVASRLVGLEEEGLS